MPTVLLYGDTERSAALRHEIPIAIGDPVLYAEVDGRTFIEASPLERDRLAAACPHAELIDDAELGLYELRGSGMSRDEVVLELTSRAVKSIGISKAIVDFDFPLGLAERLRADGMKLTVDDAAIKQRRRAKTAAELAGIRRAQEAAEAGIAAAAALLAQAEPVDGTLHVDGEPLLAEQVRAVLREACGRSGAPAPPEVIVASVHQGTGHNPGRGPLPAGLPIQIDLWPQDEASSCWADMTRTFLVGGEPPQEKRTGQSQNQAPGESPPEALVRTALRGPVCGHLPGIQPPQAALPGLHLSAAFRARCQMLPKLAPRFALGFPENVGHPIFTVRMIHKTVLSWINELGEGKGAGRPRNCGSSSRLRRDKASAMRELTVPSGISRTSAIWANLRSS